jgi:hypothetical protein
LYSLTIITSFCRTCSEIATRDSPYPDQTGVAVATAVCNNGLKPSFGSAVPGDFVEVLMKCFAEEPERRPTFVQLKKQLQAVYDTYT